MKIEEYKVGQKVAIHGMCEPVCYYTSDSFEVVGNIFENPELLEKVG